MQLLRRDDPLNDSIIRVLMEKCSLALSLVFGTMNAFSLGEITPS